MRKKVGIMGGTFDPIHIGHLLLGEAAFEQFQLEKVLFMPAGKPPHKAVREGGATDRARVEMVKRAISTNPHFELSLHEMKKEGYTYTYATLEELHQMHPDTDFYFIIGADSLFDIPKWKYPQRICNGGIILVAVRDDKSLGDVQKQIEILQKEYGGTFYTLNFPSIGIASHELRSWVSQGRSIKYCVNDEVLSYIKEEGLYQDSITRS